MKNQFSKLFAPAAVFTFAIAGAFATHAMNTSESKVAPPLTGWERHAPNVCEASIQCRTEQNVICTSPTSGMQLFAKDASGDCVVKLYKIPN